MLSQFDEIQRNDGGPSQPTSFTSELDSPIATKVGTFLKVMEQVVAICNSEATWETKYDLIFSKEVQEGLSGSGIHVIYCDPDTTYEEDVRAFVKAIVEKANDLRKTGLAPTESSQPSIPADCHIG